MGGTVKKIFSETPPLYIILPICTEANVDIFINILKNAVSRMRMAESHLENAFRAGMAGEILSIHEYDISVNWEELHSKTQQIRQCKLLGYWAIHNYPLLGKKLFGESYNPPERKSVMVTDKENSSLMTADEVDSFIFPKMKLRAMELNVSQSTWVKLKHFVKVPATIRKCNELKLSIKMNSFDITDDCIENCWKALKSGKFSANFEVSFHSTKIDF